MTTLYLGLLLLGSSALLGYTAYVHTLVIAQRLIVWLLPLVGALLVHWFYRLHGAKPHRPDRAFIPHDVPPAEDRGSV